APPTPPSPPPSPPPKPPECGIGTPTVVKRGRLRARSKMRPSTSMSSYICEFEAPGWLGGWAFTGVRATTHAAKVKPISLRFMDDLLSFADGIARYRRRPCLVHWRSRICRLDPKTTRSEPAFAKTPLVADGREFEHLGPKPGLDF